MMPLLPRGLRTRLIVLLSVAMLPAIALLVWQGFERRRDGESAIEAQALALARLAAQAQERRIEGGRQVLIALAAFTDTPSDQPQECASELRALLVQYEGLYSDIGWADRSGRVICHAIEERSSISIADREYFQRTLLERRFVVSDMIQGKLRATPILALSAPVFDRRGELTGVVFANIRLASMSAALRDAQPAQAGATLAVLDRSGALIARSFDADRYMGVRASREQIQEIISRGHMVATFDGADGVNRVHGLSVVRDAEGQPAMFISVGFPRDTLMAGNAARFRSDLAIIVTFAIGALLAAWIATERLVRRPVQALLDATRGLGSGRLDTRAATIDTTNEFATLASSFNRMADQLEQREVRLRQAQRLEAVGQLAGGIAHDFNNLLTVIIGYCYSLTDQVRPNSTAVRELNELRSAAERAAALTHQLLAVSQRQLLSPKILDLNDLVRGTQPVLQQAVGGRIAVEAHLDPQLPFVMVDQVQFEQVIVDLVTNSRDRMPDGGVIRIQTRRATTEENGATIAAAELCVSDNGRGMDAATSARIFEPFFTTRGPGVNGLGLATVYGIIEQSGGSITCKSVPGEGTKFVVTLPAVTIPAATAPSPTTLVAHA